MVRDDRSETAPLTVTGTTYTDGTFSTVTLDSTLIGRSTTQQHRREPPGVRYPTSSRCHLVLILAVTTTAALILYHYRLWFGVATNVLIVITGMATLVAGQSRKNVHLVTLRVWLISALVGLVLFFVFLVLHGRELIPEWCLEYAYGKYSDYDITMSVCATLEDDGTFDKIWIGVGILGFLLGFPFVFFAILTVYRFYVDTKAFERSPGC